MPTDPRYEEVMRHDKFVNGEATSGVRGRMCVPLEEFLSQEMERRAFNAYKIAFRRNEAHPCLRNASALVKAWNRYAAVVGGDQA